MKKIFVVSILLLNSLMLKAQVDENDFVKKKVPQKTYTIIKSSPFPILSGSIPIFTAEYRAIGEFITSPNTSFQAGVSYLGKSVFWGLSDTSTQKDSKDITVRGFRIQAEYRYYVGGGSKLAPEGFYIAPHGSYSTANISTKLARQAGYFIGFTNVNAMFICGYQVFINNFAMDFFGGIGYKSYTAVENSRNGKSSILADMPRYMNNNIKIKIGVNFGLAQGR